MEKVHFQEISEGELRIFLKPKAGSEIFRAINNGNGFNQILIHGKISDKLRYILKLAEISYKGIETKIFGLRPPFLSSLFIYLKIFKEVEV